MIRFTSIALFGLLASSQGFTPTQTSRQSTILMATHEISNIMDRRTLGGIISSAAAIAAGSTLLPEASNAAVMTSQPKGGPRKFLNKEGVKTYFKGKISVKDLGISPEVLESASTVLLVTARPKNPANMPSEVLASTGGTIPSVFSTIIPRPKLDGEQIFTLTSNDITLDGKIGTKGDPYWWAEEPEWCISARVGTDRSVKTSDPSDLVGRVITSEIGQDKQSAGICLDIQLSQGGFSPGSKEEDGQTV